MAFASFQFTIHFAKTLAMQHFRKCTLCEIVREFIVNLWVNWNWGCLKNCFPSPGSSMRLHSLCALFQCVLFVRLWREFIVNLWVNWNLGCLKNCFPYLQAPARVFIVCARCFSAFCACPELCYDFECPKVLKFWEGCVHTSILTICICFLNCCFGILMSRSFSFKRSIWQVNPGSRCLETACPKEASGNTLHHHTCVAILCTVQIDWKLASGYVWLFSWWFYFLQNFERGQT